VKIPHQSADGIYPSKTKRYQRLTLTPAFQGERRELGNFNDLSGKVPPVTLPKPLAYPAQIPHFFGSHDK
jgi:hypothetical protein